MLSPVSVNPLSELSFFAISTPRLPLEAIPTIERATRLDSASNHQYLHFLGMAYLLAGKYETAAALLQQRILLVPETDYSRVALASALGHLGEVDEAPESWERWSKSEQSIDD